MNHWKILYFHSTVKPHFTDTSLLRTPHYGQFGLSLGKKAFMPMLKRQEHHNEGTQLTALITTNRSHYKMDAI